MKARSEGLRTALLALVAAISVTAVRGRLYEVHRHLREGADVYELPPPEKVVQLSLGYRAALADLLWSNVLVSQGMHLEHRLRYENVTGLIETINELDPTFKDPYLFAETLITYQIGKTPHEDVVATRAILERGVRERPLDGDMWLALGEWVAYVAPGSYLTDPAEQASWRVDGSLALARAAELGGDNTAWLALGGASLLSRAGERDAAVRFLERALAVTDDAELQASLRAHLKRLRSEQQEEAINRFNDALLAERHADLPYVSRTQFVVLGPPRDPERCAGPEHALDVACMGTWRARERQITASRPGETAP